MKKNLLKICGLSLALALIAQVSFAQTTGTVVGKIIDNETGEAVTGANVVVQGTTIGAASDLDGEFKITGVPTGKQKFEVSFISYERMTIEKNVAPAQDQVTDLGTIKLKIAALGMQEVQVIASIGIDRETPVAMSNIKAIEIEETMGNQEFPEVLESTPGVYATKSGGGFGDSDITIRGFESVNVGVLINGVPVNDMENGRVYWSNWAGLADATQTVQIQRGLGASKVAIPSIGGTINIISKASDADKGGSVSASVGNDGYQKQIVSASTGLTEDNLAVTFSIGQVSGNGYVDGTSFEGYQYFANIAKKINDNHEVTLTAIGASQEHGQRQSRSTISDYKNSDRGIRYNPDWGYKNGQETSIEDNFYTKPLFSLNHYWTISPKLDVSTAAYYSIGTGGGGGTATNGGDYDRRDGVVDFETIVDQNIDNGEFGSTAILRASHNNHQWAGALSSANYALNENIDILAGLDYRYYKGEHYQTVTDLLGGEYFPDDADVNNPNRALQVGDKRSYYNDGIVNWGGGFLQGEYSKDNLSAFATLQASNTSYQRVDYFNYLDSDPNQTSPVYNFFAFGTKGGANYNLTKNHNVFANLGYFERAPFFNTVFPVFTNEANIEAENEKILSYELGYGYRGSKFSANVNVYRTTWTDKTFQITVPNQGPQGTNLFANILGVEAIHQGLEIDFLYEPIDGLTFNGMGSFGDWRWNNNIENVSVFDENNQEVRTVSLFIADTKVGGSAQTTAMGRVSYEILDGLTVRGEYSYFDNIYARFDVLSRTTEESAGVNPWQAEATGLVDLGASYKFSISDKVKATVLGNVYNVFDTYYIKNASQNSQDPNNPLVWFETGRTWSATFRVNF
ncbi:TonB-dependent receptor [Marivirga salinae]|uniref:TonB-dependent receptor n=1 Tax=Marivirga salinarum TaxID=3059078 RepID=A0AA51NBA3_9BACT|nr:TonB-dependent receptor [Marivirga sp. BDSF4-3]WMN11978.1 TonB-dependent receptor [Marivirga sp. BDSF4-3]